MHRSIHSGVSGYVRIVLGQVLLVFAIGIGSASPAHAQGGVAESAIKAAIVSKFFLFVDWPKDSGEIRLCVAGRGDTSDAVMAEQGRVVKGQVIETVRLVTPDAVPGRQCRILFIAASAGNRAAEFAQAAAGSAVLIVAEGDALGPERAHVLLSLENRRPVLIINLTEARRTGLDISARLLQLARRVL